MGSGKVLGYAKDKYGLESFEKEILHTYNNTKEMYAKEKELVNEEFITREDTYNIKIGGFGGFDYLNSKEYDNPTHSKDHMAKMFELAHNSDGKEKHKIAMQNVDHKASRAKCSNTMQERYGNDRSMLASMKYKNHTDDTKKKISTANKGKCVGEDNSQYGTCWIKHKQYGNKKIKKDFLSTWLNEGWERGRHIQINKRK